MAIINKVLVGSVAVVGVIASGAYVVRFWGVPISNNSSDWANFATYISGTIGVSAVVATLIAFVKTLGQQQKLIDSQEDMLVEQKRHIDLAQAQNEELKWKHAIDIAYSNAKEFFPDFCSSFERSLKEAVPPYPNQEGLKRAFEDLDYSRQQNREAMIKNPARLHALSGVVESGELESYVDRLFGNIDRMYKFMVNQVKSAPELQDYFDNYLSVSGGGVTKPCFYFYCYHAYLMGRGESALFGDGVKCLGFYESYQGAGGTLKSWVSLGEKLEQVSKDRAEST